MGAMEYSSMYGVRILHLSMKVLRPKTYISGLCKYQQINVLFVLAKNIFLWR